MSRCRGSQINCTPMGRDRYRQIFRKKKVTMRRKPLGPPIGEPMSRVVVPFHELPVHVQAAQARARQTAGDFDD